MKSVDEIMELVKRYGLARGLAATSAPYSNAEEAVALRTFSEIETALRAALDWTPVEVKTPTMSGDYEVTYAHGANLDTGRATWKRGQWLGVEGRVTAWRALPAPYQAKGVGE